jgi:nicotinamidase-related amidase
MSEQIILTGLTLDQFRAEMAGIVRDEVATIVNQSLQKAETVNHTAIPKLELSVLCGVAYNTLQKWLRDDGIDHVTYSGLDDFKARHRKHSR